MLSLLRWWIESRRKVRRADFAVSILRKEAAMLRRGPGRDTMERRVDRSYANYLDKVADLIENTP